jgi:hypothetical protein
MKIDCCGKSCTVDSSAFFALSAVLIVIFGLIEVDCRKNGTKVMKGTGICEFHDNNPLITAVSPFIGVAMGGVLLLRSCINAYETNRSASLSSSPSVLFDQGNQDSAALLSNEDQLESQDNKSQLKKS